MSNHFHWLVRVPHRPEGFDVPLEVVVARLERALGGESAKLMHRNLDFWRTTKNEAAIEEWRQQQVGPDVLPAWAGDAVGLCRVTTAGAIGRSLSEFMKAIQLRFCLLRRLCENGFTGFQPQSRRAVAKVESPGRAQGDTG